MAVTLRGDFDASRLRGLAKKALYCILHQE